MKFSFVIVRVCFLVVAGLITCKAFPQLDCTVKNFNTANGLPQNTITGMAFDDMGFLWLGTQNGLIRYDGSGFNPFILDTKSSSTNISNNVLHISYIQPENKILIRTRNGHVYTIEKGNPIIYSKKITTSYFYELTGRFPNLALFDKFNVPIDELTGPRHNWNADIKYILPVNKTDFIVQGKSKKVLFFYKNGVKQKELLLNYSLKSLFRTADNSILVDSSNNFYFYDPSAIEFKKLKTDWSAVKKGSEAISSARIFWDSFNDEGYCLYNSIFYFIDLDAREATIKFIPKFSIKEKGHFWTRILYNKTNSTYFLSTLTEGLFQVKLKNIQTFDIAEMLPENKDPMGSINYSILKTSDSTLLTTSGYGFSIKDQKVTVKKKGNFISNRETIGLLGDSAIICAQKNKLFYYLRADGYQRPRVFNTFFNEHNNDYISAVYPEGDSVWVCTKQTISAVSRKTETIVFKRKVDEGSVYFSPRMFCSLTKDEILFGNNFGLFKLKKSPPYTIDTIHALKDKQVRHISRYKDMLIISAYKTGLYVYTNNFYYKVPISADQPELASCHSTYIDKNGNIWIPTDKGLFRSTVAAIVESALKPAIEPFFFNYGVADGIKNPEFNGGGTPSFAVMSNERLFYPSMGGIVTFEPKDLNDKIANNAIPIEKIYMGDKEISPLDSDSIFLNAGFKYLVIDLDIPHFGEPKNLLVEYKVDEEDWQKIIISNNNQRIAILELSAGYHKLTIRKRTGFGGSDHVYKTLTLHRDKYIYERLWFYPAVLLAFILLIMLIIGLKTRSINKNRRHLQKLVDEQTSELSKTVEIKELLINIISHDMISPLRHISFISSVLKKGLETDPEKVIEALEDIKTTSDKIMSGSLGILNWMKYNNSRVVVNRQSLSVHDIINEIFEIFHPLAKKKDIELINDVSESEFAEIDHNIFSILLNNIVSNAIKYSKNGKITVYLEKGLGKKVFLKIKDTGPGINKHILDVINELIKGNTQVLTTTNKAGTGLGYILISEMIKIHNMSITVESELNVGTTVSIQLQ